MSVAPMHTWAKPWPTHKTTAPIIPATGLRAGAVSTTSLRMKT